MNILPKNYSQFKDKDYWDSFFSSLKSTKNEYFQWYGQFSDFKILLMQTFNNIYNLNNKNKTFKAFHVGCGKSIFGEEIVKGLGFFDIKMVHCDYSQSIIHDMNKRKKQLGLSENNNNYEVCDLLQPLDEKYINFFDTVIDKGTLDAMLPEDKPQNIVQIKQKYFRNIEKSMKSNGISTYAVISMLQPFILKVLLQYFFNDQYKITISECIIKDSQMHPFLIEIQKDKANQLSQKQQIVIKLLNKSIVKYNSINETLQKIKQLQNFNAYTTKLKKLGIGQSATFDIFDDKISTKVRYVIEMIDSSQKEILLKNTCSVFIVPQGQQQIYSQPEQKSAIQDQISTSRLIMVKLMPGNQFNSLSQVQQELNPILPNLIQSNINIKDVPYLTDGSIGSENDKKQ